MVLQRSYVNIFVGLSQNQLDNFELVIKQMRIEKEENILLTSGTLTFNRNLYKKVFTVDTSFDNRSGNAWQALVNINRKIKAYKKLIEKIEPYRTASGLRVFFSYIEDVLSNHMALSFNKRAVGIVVEDGILNYYHHTIKSLPRHKVLLKYLLSNLNGVRFRWYKGHSSGIDYPHVEKQYVRLPELSIRPEKSRKLEVPPVHIDRFTPTLVVVGQEAMEGKIGSRKYYRQMSVLFDKVVEIVNKHRVEKVYYKPHRHGKRLKKTFLNEKLRGIPYEILSASAPLENLYFDRLKSRFVVGFNSSAIINISIQLARRDALHAYVFMKKDDMLREIFAKLNCKIFDLE